MLVLATGGLSDLFINEVSEDIIVNKDLTITGLFLAYEEGKYK
jgi:pantothenate kinase type III